ncbi:MAG: hypothetical protein QOI44_660 [Actinomycetota bacterium]|jgi:hypothetical protein|nr:hypothetical protein [Actinomycetota bacterium]
MLAYEFGFSGFFKVILVLHILSAIVGIGGVMLNGLYAAQAMKRPGPAGRAVSEANYFVSNIAEKVIYLVPVFGILLVLASDGAFKFSTTFVWLSLLLFVGALGVAHSILIPGHKKINELLLEMEQGPPPVGGPPPQLAQVEALGKRQAAAGMTLDVVLTTILVLMIWQPGL